MAYCIEINVWDKMYPSFQRCLSNDIKYYRGLRRKTSHIKYEIIEEEIVRGDKYLTIRVYPETLQDAYNLGQLVEGGVIDKYIRDDLKETDCKYVETFMRYRFGGDIKGVDVSFRAGSLETSSGSNSFFVSFHWVNSSKSFDTRGLFESCSISSNDNGGFRVFNGIYDQNATYMVEKGKAILAKKELILNGIDVPTDISNTRIELLNSEIKGILDDAISDAIKHSKRRKYLDEEGISQLYYDDYEQLQFTIIKLQEAYRKVSYRWVDENTSSILLNHGNTLPPVVWQKATV